MTNRQKKPGASDQPTDRSRGGGTPSEPAAPMAPGDEAPQGEPGTGENTCPRCDGTGLDGVRPWKALRGDPILLASEIGQSQRR
jgi:hypothetical protein